MGVDREASKSSTRGKNGNVAVRHHREVEVFICSLAPKHCLGSLHRQMVSRDGQSMEMIVMMIFFLMMMMMMMISRNGQSVYN